MSAAPDAFALTADIHGNVWALRAVLDDIDRRGVSMIFDLGDSLLGPLAPAETCDLLMERGILSIRGNDDSALLVAPVDVTGESARYAIGRLEARHFEWLRALPSSRRLGDVLLFHATPHSELDYLLEEVLPDAVVLRDTAGIRRLLGVVGARLFACGHTHVPRTVSIGDGITVINPGSVGLPAYRAETPWPHRMETGSPHARYAIVRGNVVEHVAVDYDAGAAAACAERNGRQDWSHWVRTGRA